ncbi:MAG TPA: hypothetical protein V6C81_24000 [Planktothrix sp.]|jgi:hypothetical protein
MDSQGSKETKEEQGGEEQQQAVKLDRAARQIQATTDGPDFSGLTDNELKWERDVFRDVLNNANQTLRFQIQMAVPLLAGCVTVLNIVPPQAHQELLNDLDRWVFIPAILSIALAYRALEFHFYSYKNVSKLDADVHQLYKLVQYKQRMVRFSILFQALGLLLLMVFVLLEYK